MKQVELVLNEKGNIVAVFSEKDIRHYGAYQFVQEIKSQKNYLIAHKNEGCFDLFEVAPFKDKATGVFLEKECLKIKEPSGFTRLFGWDGCLETYFIAFQGYDFSPFGNVMIYNLEKESRVVIFNEERILVEEIGVLVSCSEHGIIVADKHGEDQKTKCWAASADCPDYLEPMEIKAEDFRKSPKSGNPKKTLFEHLKDFWCQVRTGA